MGIALASAGVTVAASCCGGTYDSLLSCEPQRRGNGVVEAVSGLTSRRPPKRLRRRVYSWRVICEGPKLHDRRWALARGAAVGSHVPIDAHRPRVRVPARVSVGLRRCGARPGRRAVCGAELHMGGGLLAVLLSRR